MAERGFNIGVFKAELDNKKILRPNLFHVEFSVPPGLLNIESFEQNKETVRTLEYWCETASLPGVILNTYQAQRYGYGSLEQRPILPVFNEIQLAFIFDADTANYSFFYDWISMIINFNMREGPNETTGAIAGIKRTVPFELAYKFDYMTDISIMIYDPTGRLVKKLTLREAFPKAIGDISLSWIDNNSYLRLPVIIAFTDWYIQQTDIPNTYEEPEEIAPGSYFDYGPLK